MSSNNCPTMATAMSTICYRFLWGLVVWEFLCLQIAAAPRPYGGSDAASDDVCVTQCGSPSPPHEDAGSSSEGRGKWRWEPTSTSHPCTIRRVSRAELRRLFGEEGVPNLYPLPLVIQPDADDDGGSDDGRRDFANLTTRDHLPSNFPPDFQVTLTGSDSLSSNRRTLPLRQYLREVWETNGGETLPDRLGNETWYLFGETFSPDWTDFLRRYDPLPPCRSCTPAHRARDLVALAFGAGNAGSGVQWHLHGPGFSETIHGRKHWVLYPPGERPAYDLDYASRHWMEHAYPGLDDWTAADVAEERRGHEEYLRRRGAGKGPRARDGGDGGPSGRKPWECTIHEGEMVYFPDQWHHATINLDRYTVFVSSFTTEH